MRSLLAADGDTRTVVADHSAGYFGTVIENGTLIPTPGVQTWIAERDFATRLASDKQSA